MCTQFIRIFKNVCEICCMYLQSRAVGRSENQKVSVLFGVHNLPPLVEIGLTDWQNLRVPHIRPERRIL